MSATTVFGQVRSDQASTHSKRNAVIALTIIALFAVSFFVGRATASSHVSSTSSSAQVATHPQLSPANRAIIAGEVAPLSNASTTERLSPANRALIAGEVAPLSNASTTEQLSPANRAIIAEYPSPVPQQLSQALTGTCVAGRPC
jgi:hypothetical protein